MKLGRLIFNACVLFFALNSYGQDSLVIQNNVIIIGQITEITPQSVTITDQKDTLEIPSRIILYVSQDALKRAGGNIVFENPDNQNENSNNEIAYESIMFSGKRQETQKIKSEINPKENNEKPPLLLTVGAAAYSYFLIPYSIHKGTPSTIKQ